MKLTLAEAVRVSGFGMSTMHYYVQHGIIPSEKDQNSNRVYVDSTDLIKYMEAHENTENPFSRKVARFPVSITKQLLSYLN